MKKTFLYVLMLFIGFKMYSQTVLEYTYDEAGNQTFRKEKTSSSGDHSIIRPIDTDDKKPDKITPQEINNKFIISPNPTSGLVELKWNSNLSESITKIELISIQSSERIDIPLTKNNLIGIDLSNKPAGLYIIFFHLNNETVSSVQKKIIKF